MSNKILHACITHNPSQTDYNKNESLKNYKGSMAAFQKGTTWAVDAEIKISFIKGLVTFQNSSYDSNYSKDKADWVEKVIRTKIDPIVGLKFIWDVPESEGDIRISFIEKLGAFSYVGTQALNSQKNEMTMNLGWLDRNRNGAVVIHEFGHALGMIHEHQREDADLVWNKEVVYRTMAEPPHKWSRRDVDSQIFSQNELSSFNGSEYDKYSIMHYIYPNEFFLNNPNLKNITKLSKIDVEWLNKIYPGGNEVGSNGGNEGGSNGGNEAGSNGGNEVGSKGGNVKDFFKKNWFEILLGIIILLLIALLFKRVLPLALIVCIIGIVFVIVKNYVM